MLFFIHTVAKNNHGWVCQDSLKKRFLGENEVEKRCV